MACKYFIPFIILHLVSKFYIEMKYMGNWHAHKSVKRRKNPNISLDVHYMVKRMRTPDHHLVYICFLTITFQIWSAFAFIITSFNPGKLSPRSIQLIGFSVRRALVKWCTEIGVQSMLMFIPVVLSVVGLWAELKSFHFNFAEPVHSPDPLLPSELP